jgi:hypothetical protein
MHTVLDTAKLGQGERYIQQTTKLALVGVLAVLKGTLCSGSPQDSW